MRPLPPSPPSESDSNDSQIPQRYGIPAADFNWPWYREQQEQREQEQEHRKRLEDEEAEIADTALYRVTLCFAILCFLTLYLSAYVFLRH